MTRPVANENLPGRTPRELFGRHHAAFPIPPLHLIRAALIEQDGEIVGIQCGEMRLILTHPVYRLCCQLKLSGWEDAALQVRNRDRTPAVFIPSFWWVADWPADDLKQWKM